MKRAIILTIIMLAIGLTLHLSGQDRIDIRPEDTCVLEYVNTKTGNIRIGSNSLTIGQRFKADDPIHWTSFDQSLKARNLRTGEILRFSAREFNGETASIFTKKVGTYTKGTSDMSDILSNTFYIVDDTLFIPSSIPLGEQDRIVLVQIPGGKTINAPYDDETNEIVIFRQALESCGIDIASTPARFHVEYWHATDNGVRKTALTDKMIIEYVPSVK